MATKKKKTTKKTKILSKNLKFSKTQALSVVAILAVAGVAFVLFTHAAAKPPAKYLGLTNYADAGSSNEIRCGDAIFQKGAMSTQYCVQDTVPTDNVNDDHERGGFYNLGVGLSSFVANTGFYPYVRTTDHFNLSGFHTCKDGTQFMILSWSIVPSGTSYIGEAFIPSGAGWTVQPTYANLQTKACTPIGTTEYKVIN